MQTDIRGYSVATDESVAVESLDRAFDAYVGFRTDAMAELDTAIAADPSFALAHVIKGILMTGLKKPEVHPAARAELEQARAGREPVTSREKHYLDTLHAMLDGYMTVAISHLEQIVLLHPHDLFAMRLAQSELFWIGEVGWMRDISERAASHWSADMRGFSSYLSIRSFGLEENGAYAEAERCGREAVEIDPCDCWGTHAVAHVLLMQGRLAEGREWVADLSTNWGHANHIVHHLWWHLALFHAEAGDFDAALELYDQKLRDLDSPLMQALPDFYIDIQNDASLLQRLELRGIDVGDRWQAVAELALSRRGNHESPFTSAHCALALAAAGRFELADELLTQIRAFAAEAENAFAPRYALAVMPASAAAIAYRGGEFQRVIELLLPARHNLWQMGGSHAQRDLFFQLLVDSALKLGRADLIAMLMQELGGIGFDRIEERSSYADAMAFTLDSVDT